MTYKRIDSLAGERVEMPDVDAYIEELIAVSEKHGMSLAHEDTQGSFVVQDVDVLNFQWLRLASVERFSTHTEHKFEESYDDNLRCTCGKVKS